MDGSTAINTVFASVNPLVVGAGTDLMTAYIAIITIGVIFVSYRFIQGLLMWRRGINTDESPEDVLVHEQENYAEFSVDADQYYDDQETAALEDFRNGVGSLNVNRGKSGLGSFESAIAKKRMSVLSSKWSKRGNV
jgi:hypothetical protein